MRAQDRLSFLRACWCVDAVVFLLEFKTTNKHKQLFVHNIMLQQLNAVGDSCESTLVLKRKADILCISYGISIHQ